MKANRFCCPLIASNTIYCRAQIQCIPFSEWNCILCELRFPPAGCPPENEFIKIIELQIAQHTVNKLRSLLNFALWNCVTGGNIEKSVHGEESDGKRKGFILSLSDMFLHTAFLFASFISLYQFSLFLVSDIYFIAPLIYLALKSSFMSRKSPVSSF